MASRYLQQLETPTESYSIFSARSPQEQLNKIAEYDDKGIPFVLTGLNQHPSWDEFASSSADLYTAVVPESLAIEANGHLLQYASDPPENLTKPTMQDVFDGVPCTKAPLALVDHTLLTRGDNEASLTWFITSSKNAHAMALYLENALADFKLGPEEPQSIPQERWLEVPFAVFVHKQEVGDLVVFPRRSYHQAFVDGNQQAPFSVIQWTRMTAESIVDAFHEEIPVQRRRALPEEISIKSLCHSILIEAARSNSRIPPSTVEAVLAVYDKILQDECLPPGCVSVDETPINPSPQTVLRRSEGDARCGFCKCFLFSIRLRCLGRDGCETEESYSLCVTCYVEGRICKCKYMVLEECRSFSDLIVIRDNAVAAIGSTSTYLDFDNFPSSQVIKSVCVWMKTQHDRRAVDAPAEKTRSCRIPGVKVETHSLPAPEVFPCQGRDGNGCSGHGHCFPHALVKWCMHSSSLIDYKSMVKDFATFHHVHESFTVNFHNIFGYHIGPRHKRQFRIPPDLELKHQEAPVALAWLALMFKPVLGDMISDRGTLGWYDHGVATPKWVFVMKASRPKDSPESAVESAMDVDEQPSAPETPSRRSTAPRKRKRTESDDPSTPSQSPTGQRASRRKISPSKQQLEDHSPLSPGDPTPLPATDNPAQKANSVPRDQFIEVYSDLYREIIKNRKHLPADAQRSVGDCMHAIEKAFNIGVLEINHEEPAT